MSGGSLNYAYSRVEDIAHEVRMRAETNLHRSFASHLMKVAKALHDIEWVLSCDYAPCDEVDAIRAVVTRNEEIDQAKATAKELIEELQAFVKGTPK